MADREATKDGCKVPDAFRFAVTSIATSHFGVIRMRKLIELDLFQPIPLGDADGLGKPERLLVGYPYKGDCVGQFQPYNMSVPTFRSGPRNYGYANASTYAGMIGGPPLARSPEDAPITSYGIHIRGVISRAPTEPRSVRFNRAILAQIGAL